MDNRNAVSSSSLRYNSHDIRYSRDQEETYADIYQQYNERDDADNNDDVYYHDVDEEDSKGRFNSSGVDAADDDDVDLPSHLIESDDEETQSSNLLKREEELRLKNEQLEAKARVVVSQADALVKTHEERLASSRSGLNSRGSNASILNSDHDRSLTSQALTSRPSSATSTRSVTVDENTRKNATPRTTTSRLSSSRLSVRSETSSNSCDTELTQQSQNAADHLPKTELELAAEHMPVETALKFYKAQVAALKQEMHDLVVELKEKDSKLLQYTEQAKEMQEERKKTAKSLQSLQQKYDKQKQIGDEATEKCRNLETQVKALTKELETAQRSQKQVDVEQQSKDVRLVRALEEIDKLKTQLREAKSAGRDANDSTRKELDRLRQENKKLERQKQELLSAFKKQLKLIDILKRQKLHIEAAKLLSFTEEEFMKTLENPTTNA